MGTRIQSFHSNFFPVVVWARLPKLPIEFYDPTSLLKIGKAIGLVLRIDSHTVNGARGRFARLCVQVNLDKPLIRTVYIGKLAQSIQLRALVPFVSRVGELDTRKGHALISLESLLRKKKRSRILAQVRTSLEAHNMGRIRWRGCERSMVLGWW